MAGPLAGRVAVVSGGGGLAGRVAGGAGGGERAGEPREFGVSVDAFTDLAGGLS